jgi:hypothetical protein
MNIDFSRATTGDTDSGAKKQKRVFSVRRAFLVVYYSRLHVALIKRHKITLIATSNSTMEAESV